MTLTSLASPSFTALLTRARDRARVVGRPMLASVSERIRPVDPLAVCAALERMAAVDPNIAQQLTIGRMFWSRPAERFALLGIGAAVRFTPAGSERFATVDCGWATLLGDAVTVEASPRVAVGPVLMGGFAFDAAGPHSAPWKGFASTSMTLPRVQLTVSDGACWTTTNVLVDEQGRPDADLDHLAQLSALVRDPCAASTMPQKSRSEAGDGLGNAAREALTFADVRPASAWRGEVRTAVEAIGGGAFEKVVLARAVRAEAAGELDILQILQHLRAAYPESYVFGCWRGEHAFVGASPERLVRLDGRAVRVSSLAGSTRRSAHADEDARLTAALQASDKDRTEHRLVLDVLRRELAGVCDEVTAPAEPAVLTLPNVHHLYSPVRATLRAGYSLLDLVARLHPTPAVGGTPRDAALAFLRAHEQLDRGWYAAPVGWMGRDHGEFAVGLRSALVAGREAWLYAGCGIVADSDADEEYAESLLKLRPMQGALAAAVGDRAAR